MSNMWPFTKKHPKRHVLDDQDREISLATRKLKAKEKEIEMEKKELKWQIEKAELMSRLEEYNDYEEDSDDNNIVELLGNFIIKNKEQTQQPSNQISQGTDTLTDEQIKETISKFPKSHIKIAKNLPENLQYIKAKEFFPTLTDDTLRRAIEILKEVR